MGQRWAAFRQEIVPVAKDSWAGFQRHNGQWLAAALAYFAAFAIAPLIIVVVEIAGLAIKDHQRVLNLIFSYLQRDAGAGAGAVKQIVAATFNEPRKGIVAEIIGWIVFVVAALGLFGAVQFALNTIWEVVPKNLTLMENIRQRAAGFGVMLGIALLLLLSIGANALLTVMATYFTHIFPGFATLVKIADFAISFAVLWGAFSLLYEYLPECRIEWRDVWVGAAVTSFLFVVGQFLLGWYLGRAGISSGYGAFGSLVVFLIWVNYSAQIVLFGAEVTRVYARRYGSQAQSNTTRGEVAASSRTAVRV
ncbi:MAG TPA: YihY/virulence factor BrkB family protein [Candidatus Baltobacteraceae bacterium]|jgi:membrane protein|nr:YihY/virulence factor BrkB family protein [Candidatus Baltobacteraceae bacterium]